MTLPVKPLTLSDGRLLVVPESIQYLAPYVLFEQGEWFEEELSFVRSLLKPGMNTIDIGANYGVYTTAMARAVSPHGRVMAFEPTSAVASCLAQSLELNALTKIVCLEQMGLSNRNTSAELILHDNPEMNHLGDPQSERSDAAREMVQVRALDTVVSPSSLTHVEFLKIDAEGEEENILEGAENLLHTLSPLVMFEFKHNEQLNTSLIDRFIRLGYHPYYLIPSLQILVPCDPALDFDPYLLNLFACKHDRALELEGQGVLVRSFDEKTRCTVQDNRWMEWVAAREYAVPFLSRWTQRESSSPEYAYALSCYAESMDMSRAPGDRLGLLKSSYRILTDLVALAPTFCRQMSLARVAGAYGLRKMELDITIRLFEEISQTTSLNTDEPFLPVCTRYDRLNPSNRIVEWLTSSLLEQFELRRAFSSYYTGKESLPLLERLLSLGFAGEEVKRRYQLVIRRFTGGQI